jgi:hypothetical protein
MARPSYAKSQHVILDFQRIVVFVTFTWSHFVCSQDADAGLDEDEIVRVAHMYRVVAGDSVSRSLAHLDFYAFFVLFLRLDCDFDVVFYCSIASRFSIGSSQLLALNADVRVSVLSGAFVQFSPARVSQIASSTTRLVVGQSLCVAASSSCDSKA